jgi:hypothetical protein
MTAGNGAERRIVRQDEDIVPTRRIVLVLIVTIAVTLGGILWAGLLLGFRERALRPEGTAGVLLGAAAAGERKAPPGPQAIFGEPFDLGMPGQEENRRARERLASWGWVDREKGVVHVPVEEVMKWLAEGAGGREGGRPAR